MLIKGDLDQAVADYTKALEINPSDAAAYHNGGIAWYKKGNICRSIGLSIRLAGKGLLQALVASPYIKKYPLFIFAIGVFFGIFCECLLAADCTKIVGFPFIFVSRGSIFFIDIHLANRVDSHLSHLPSWFIEATLGQQIISG